MDNIAIKVENLTKKYLLKNKKAQTVQYTALRDVITNSISNVKKSLEIFKNNRNIKNDNSEVFYALNEVNFEVKKGERIGIIGRNGAGKSTLLKIISRITQPTQGIIKINGRVSSLLEVGTGFHPELSGRENIYLNGAILGMSRNEIRRKFDEIVNFAEIEKFLDTPVKHYSSGMYVRLAFSVASHLEPEILIVDEVLAVGDADFQKKCLGKMENVSDEGKTILFVSHNMNAIEKLCNRIITLENGCIVNDTKNINEALSKYLNIKSNNEEYTWQSTEKNKENQYIKINRLKLLDHKFETIAGKLKKGDILYLSIDFNIKEFNRNLNIGYSLINKNNEIIYWSCFTDENVDNWPILKEENNKLITKIPTEILNEGDYLIEIMSSIHNNTWINQPGEMTCYVKFSISGGLSESPFWYSARPGVIAPTISWISE